MTINILEEIINLAKYSRFYRYSFGSRAKGLRQNEVILTSCVSRYSRYKKIYRKET